MSVLGKKTVKKEAFLLLFESDEVRARKILDAFKKRKINADITLVRDEVELFSALQHVRFDLIVADCEYEALNQTSIPHLLSQKKGDTPAVCIREFLSDQGEEKQFQAEMDLLSEEVRKVLKSAGF